MSFSTKLIKLRKSMGLSQENLANEINVTRQTISKWELGTTIPDMEKLKLISNYFGVSVDELISETKSNENEYVNNKEFIGVDEKYIPKQNANEFNQSHVNQNKKSKKIFLIFLLPVCMVAIIFVIFISIFVKNINIFNNVFDRFNTNKDSKIQEQENYKDNKEKEFEEKKDNVYEIMNNQKEKIDSDKQEFDKLKKDIYETMNNHEETKDSIEQELENFKSSVY